jgi:hypothetical protein
MENLSVLNPPMENDRHISNEDYLFCLDRTLVDRHRKLVAEHQETFTVESSSDDSRSSEQPSLDLHPTSSSQ